MIQYIDKTALVAELEKRYKYWREKEHNSHSIESEIRMSECQHLMLLLNTLEVKEVDLEKEIENLIEKEKAFVTDNREVKYYNGDSFNHIYELEFIARHFFELGMAVNNSITAEDRDTAESIIVGLKHLEQDYHINLEKEIKWVRNKAQKGE